MKLYTTLAEAKKDAISNAKRDGCIWRVWHNRNYNSSVYNIADEFSVKNYWWDKMAYETKSPKMNEPEAVLLSPAEKELVAAVLDPDEIGRDYYPGDEKVKTSLWKKLLGSK